MSMLGSDANKNKTTADGVRAAMKSMEQVRKLGFVNGTAVPKSGAIQVDLSLHP